MDIAIHSLKISNGHPGAASNAYCDKKLIIQHLTIFGSIDTEAYGSLDQFKSF